ncbi:3D domain-containing protein [Chengkuizengella axinellae]|uniref:3D domain-containing protein n=1 Tax=Chengkuizengella axinellae TaxID=3064388 RepID=A0ABT9IV23_9BACL|nr:3D domain-containing protein [Chengkuizengella sp. 2205SS18-9]MDP5273203.1 3D domain-containing protein [Chengkuizengella sp. 2205SS18-9]
MIRSQQAPDHPEYGITASGKYVEEGETIACPPSMGFSTQVYIPYFDDTFTCLDRGGAISDGKLDVYMADLDDALKFGRRELEVEIIE